MKKIFLLLLLAGCQKETNNPQPIKNCDCNRTMEHTKHYVVGNAVTGQSGSYFGTYVLINDCTGVQYNGSWSGANGDPEPINGECYEK